MKIEIVVDGFVVKATRSTSITNAKQDPTQVTKWRGTIGEGSDERKFWLAEAWSVVDGKIADTEVHIDLDAIDFDRTVDQLANGLWSMLEDVTDFVSHQLDDREPAPEMGDPNP